MRQAIDRMQAAGTCDDCFRSPSKLQRPLCDVPQPRWIGASYADARPRIAVVLINPGGGRDQSPELSREASIFRSFHETGDYEPIRAYFSVRLRRGVRWLAWYRDVLGLDHDEIAQLNVAWCATKNDQYPAAMLRHCFDKHTSQLLRALDPEIVLLSGSSVWSFQAGVRSILPNADVVPMLHYRSRKSRDDERVEAQRVRARIEAWRASSGSPTES
jgi:hypothetical protein